MMNKQKIEITIFQALTLLLEKYRDTPNKYKQIESIYLTGVRCTRDDWMLNYLLEDPLLGAYSIKTTKHAINSDPVRRYFESHLCHNTLVTSLDFLDIKLLKKHFKSVFNRIEKESQDMMEPIIDGRRSPAQTSEYSDGIIKLNKSDSYVSLKPHASFGSATPENILESRKQKLKLIVKCMYAAIFVREEMTSGIIPLNVYFMPNSIYDKIHRGRISRIDADRRADGHHSGIHQTVLPHTLGIMRSFMPLPAEDALLDNECSSFARAADYFTYAKGSYLIPNQMFSTKVTPFVGSISGTMLVKLRVMAQLLRENQLVYNNQTEQLELFLKTFIAYMIHYAGGHSLDEYLQVLDLDVVQREFWHLNGFSNFTLKYLFQENNTEAFNTSIDQTIVYNTHILRTKALHMELEARHSQIYRPLPGSYIGTVSLNRPGTHTLYTIQDSSILGGTLLFGLIRMLDNSAVPTPTKNSFSHHLKQFCYAFCLVTVAHAFGSTIMKQENKQKNTAPPKTILNNFISATTKEILDYSIFKAPEEDIHKNTHPITKKYT